MSEEESAEKKNKKVNKMSLEEVKSAIEATEKHMGGLTSKYAQALLARRRELEAV